MQGEEHINDASKNETAQPITSHAYMRVVPLAPHKCLVCDGRGQVSRNVVYSGVDIEQCPMCHGTGVFWQYK